MAKVKKTPQKPVNRTQIAPTEAPSEPLSAMAPTPAETPEAAPQPIATTVNEPVEGTALTVAVLPNLDDLDDLLTRMTPDQLKKLKVLAAAKGLTPASVGILGGGSRLPDGSMTVEIHLDAPMTEQLEIWAEADGLTLIEEAQKRILESLENYLYGDWNPVVEQQPVAAVATTTGTVAASGAK